MPPLTPKPSIQREVQDTVQPKMKRVRVPITIKWPITNALSEMKVSNMNPTSYTLQQVRGATLVKITTSITRF
jgi:hypothetical protein